MAGVLVFDIETVPDQELLFSESQPELRALPVAQSAAQNDSPLPKIPYNRVVLIGAARLSVEGEGGAEAYRLDDLTTLQGAEPDILREFWRLAEGMRLVSFNGRHFDLPVLESRSLRHGLAVPWYFADGPESPSRGEAALHLDLLHFLSNGEPKNRARLHDYCKLVGLPGKMGIDGSRVAELVREHRTAELAAYCATDVLQTLGLFLRVQRLRGACPQGKYPAMLRAVRDAIQRITETRIGLEREGLLTFLARSDAFWLRG